MTMRQNPKGHLTVTHDSVRWGRLRDGLTVSVPLTVRFEPVDPSDGPTITLDVDEHSGSLVITRVEITASVEHPIESSAVKIYSLQKLAAIGAKRTAMPAKGWEAFEDGEPFPPSNATVMESITAATRSRVSPDRERLAEVAEHFNRSGVDGVQASLNVSRSQAYRLIRAAKSDGLIEEGQ